MRPKRLDPEVRCVLLGFVWLLVAIFAANKVPLYLLLVPVAGVVYGIVSFFLWKADRRLFKEKFGVEPPKTKRDLESQSSLRSLVHSKLADWAQRADWTSRYGSYGPDPVDEYEVLVRLAKKFWFEPLLYKEYLDKKSPEASKAAASA